MAASVGPSFLRGLTPGGVDAAATVASSPTSSTTTPSCRALKCAVSTLYRIDDFHREKIGAGFFSEVFKVTHKTNGKVMVLKMNRHRSNRNNMLKEVQLMNKLSHPNILRFEAACVHEGQLHALTEFINYGSMEQLIQRRDEELTWSVRMSLALDIAKGLAYLHSRGLFHRDLTSKNVLIRRCSDGRLSAIVADFGLAAKIPHSKDLRLPQVGSPYWMSPECLRGKFYDERADVFSYGIILCELIARLDADPDVLPRTENFGVDYIAFSAMCPECPPDFLKIAFSCVRIDPQSRPCAKSLVKELEERLLEHCSEHQRRSESRQFFEGKISQPTALTHKQSSSSEEDGASASSGTRRAPPPSEKARLHQQQRPSMLSNAATPTTALLLSVAKEMSLGDPHYRPLGICCSGQGRWKNNNPFSTLPRLREGKKLLGGSGRGDLFSSCFELPVPGEDYGEATARQAHSLPAMTRESRIHGEEEGDGQMDDQQQHQLLQGKVQMLKRLWMTTQDDAAVVHHHQQQQQHPALRRRGSCESGFFSSVDDSSARSLGSSLLTVSDLEEDLSAFLNNQRSSSVFTESTDDLTDCTDSEEAERDRIREIVHFFESSGRRGAAATMRSQKIDNLIRRVVERESRERLRLRTTATSSSQRLQLCDGIVRAKVNIFDRVAERAGVGGVNANSRRGLVKSRLAMFEQTKGEPAEEVYGKIRLAEAMRKFNEENNAK